MKFQFGAFARADNDAADTTWDNISVSTVVVPTNVLFEDDFSSNEIASDRYQVSSPFFEGGVGDIHPEAGDGVMRFVGTTTQQWWSGGTLRIVPTFEPSDSETITLTIDRVSEAGDGTALRSALWIWMRLARIIFCSRMLEARWLAIQPKDWPGRGCPHRRRII